jgi:hypothetical protein
MNELGFPIFDADNHLYETEEAFTRHLPDRYEGLFKYVQVKGRTKIAVNNVISDYIPNPTFEVVGRPGALANYFEGKNPEGLTPREIIGKPMRSVEAFRSAGPRLALLDELGLDAALMFPTLASLLEIHLADDPDLTCTVIHAFNEWLYDEWTFDYRNRIFATPIVNPCLVDRSLAELDWLLDRGAKVVLLRPAPVAGHRGTLSPFLPEFDPFWARIAESDLLVTLHASDSGYQRYAGDWEGGSRESVTFKPRPFHESVTPGRAINDAITSAICHGMLSRFPTVKLASIENGGSWAMGCLRAMEIAYKKDAARVSRAPTRCLPPQHLDQPVLGGFPRRAGRSHDSEPHPLWLRLPPPRRYDRAPRLGQRDWRSLLGPGGGQDDGREPLRALGASFACSLRFQQESPRNDQQRHVPGSGRRHKDLSARLSMLTQSFGGYPVGRAPHS